MRPESERYVKQLEDAIESLRSSRGPSPGPAAGPSTGPAGPDPFATRAARQRLAIARGLADDVVMFATRLLAAVTRLADDAGVLDLYGETHGYGELRGHGLHRDAGGDDTR